MKVLTQNTSYLEPLDIKNSKSSQTSSSLVSEYKAKIENYSKGNKSDSVNPSQIKNNEIYNKLDSHKYENSAASINKNKNISLSFIWSLFIQSKHTQKRIIINEKLQRPIWDNKNALQLYIVYFANFNLNSSLHTFSYISDYLEVLYENELYESAYEEMFNLPQ